MIHFVIGTRAQLFKMAPIMLECKKRNLAWRWIYTAQHKDTIEATLKTFKLPPPDYVLIKWDDEAKTMGKLFGWFFRALFSVFKSKKILAGYTGKQHIVLTHGDTLTTWIGAMMGKVTKTKIMHVESGLRSFNMFKPFPEEINRLITFRLSNYYACPGDWAIENLKNYNGIKINTGLNTQLDTIRFGQANCEKSDFTIPKTKYVLTSLHRYENVFNKERFEKIIIELERVAEKFQVLFVQHPATYEQLDKYSFRKRLETNKKITLIPRLEYLPFIKAAKHSEFVISDGGGNQEELYYMGKPTLLFRNETERQEGLGSTAVVSKLNREVIDEFVTNYKKFQTDPIIADIHPSAVIVKLLEKDGYGKKA